MSPFTGIIYLRAYCALDLLLDSFELKPLMELNLNHVINFTCHFGHDLITDSWCFSALTLDPDEKNNLFVGRGYRLRLHPKSRRTRGSDAYRWFK